MTEEKQKSTSPVSRQKQTGLWAAGIFSVLGLAFLVFSLVNIFVLQHGTADFSDKVLTPLTVLMFLAGLVGLFLIRRDHLIAGLWVLFGVVLIPPIMVVLVLDNVLAVSITYLVVFVFISIVWLFPAIFQASSFDRERDPIAGDARY